VAAPVRVNLAESYHEDSKYQPATLPRLLAGVAGFEEWAKAQPFGRRPSKAYPGAETVELPRPRTLWRAFSTLLVRRRSRRPAAGPLRLRTLATLLWAAQGLDHQGHRTAPSAGGLYPLELYVAARDVPGLRPGLYHYDPMRHALERLGDGDGGEVASWYLEGEAFAPAAAHVVVAAVLPRLAIKYRERAYRFSLQECGHASQNLLLAAEAAGVAALPVGGFYDDRVHDSLELDGVEEVALSLIPVGVRPKG
jgi:SagB-type dehydrogenase family enzyme